MMRSRLIAAPAARPAAAEVMTCAWGSVRLPAAHTPGTQVAPAGPVSNGRTLIPLTRQPGGIRAYKMIVPEGQRDGDQKSHEGYEWMYVLSGRLRLRLGEHDFVMKPGEAADSTPDPALVRQRRARAGRGAGPVRAPGRARPRPGPPAEVVAS